MSDPLASMGVGTGVTTPAMRSAGRELLSLALLDARNRSLQWLAAWEDLAGQELDLPDAPRHPLWLVGHAAWAQEAWTARNLRRTQGRRARSTTPRLASIDPQADAWFDPDQSASVHRQGLQLPEPDTLRQYLGDTLEVSLALLAESPETDEALHAFRLALFHEDLVHEELQELAQAMDRSGLESASAPMPPRPSQPLALPRMRWTLGHGDADGFSFDHDRGSLTVELDALEIDAQPVSWAQYMEFIDDGGYDDPRWWSPQGAAWLSRLSRPRQAPGHVLQIAGGVVQVRFGRARRVSLHEPVTHVSWHEAQAWCRWAGRVLPGQAHWEAAALGPLAGSFQWGHVHEWTQDRFEPLPGYEPDLWGRLPGVPDQAMRTVRAAAWLTPGRLRWPRRRRAVSPDLDRAFVGFRSCRPLGG